VSFCGKMHDAGALELLQEPGHEVLVRDITFDKVKAGVLVGAGKVSPVSGISQFVEDDQFFEVVSLQKQAGETGANETSASGK